MVSVRKSILYTLTQNYLVLILQLITSMVLARILRPDEVGVFSIAAAFSALASVVRDFGIAEYMIQETNLTRDKIRAAFTINIAISWTMAALMFGGSFFISSFYTQTGVGDVMRVLACNFLLIPFGAVTMAYFRRQMNFAPGFRISLVAGISSSLLAIFLGMNGHGYMSMAYSSLLGVAITVGMSMAMRPAELPRYPGLRGLREVIAFGSFASFIYIFGQLGRSAPDLVIGRVSGMEAVGFFSRANGLLDVFVRTVMGAVHSVALPYFSATRRDGGDVTKGFVQTILMTTSFGWPFYAISACLALPAIRVLYGDQWDAAVPLLRILCLGQGLELVLLMATEVLLAQSEVKRSSLLQVSLQTLKVLVMLALAPWGLYGICAGIVLASGLNLIVAYFFLRDSLALRWQAVLVACVPAAKLTLFAFLGALAGASLAEMIAPHPLLELGMGGIAGSATLIAAVFLTRHPLAVELRNLLSRLPVWPWRPPPR